MFPPSCWIDATWTQKRNDKVFRRKQMMNWTELKHIGRDRDEMEWNGVEWDEAIWCWGKQLCSQFTAAILGSPAGRQIAAVRQLEFWHQVFWKEERGTGILHPHFFEIKWDLKGMKPHSPQPQKTIECFKRMGRTSRSSQVEIEMQLESLAPANLPRSHWLQSFLHMDQNQNLIVPEYQHIPTIYIYNPILCWYVWHIGVHGISQLDQWVPNTVVTNMTSSPASSELAARTKPLLWASSLFGDLDHSTVSPCPNIQNKNLYNILLHPLTPTLQTLKEPNHRNFFFVDKTSKQKPCPDVSQADLGLVTGHGNQWAKNELHSFPWCVWGSCSMDDFLSLENMIHFSPCWMRGSSIVISRQRWHLWTSLNSKLSKSDAVHGHSFSFVANR